jgi:Glyoxalase-like domain
MTVTPWAHLFIDVPSELASTTEAFWSAATGWPTGTPWTNHPEFVSMQPPEANPYVHVQRITGSPRVHLDLLTDDIEAEAVRLVDLGAQRRRLHEWWQVMTSPGGLLLCLVRDSGRVSPGPVTWPDGHRSRVVQICVNVPPEAYPTELGFGARRPVGGLTTRAHIDMGTDDLDAEVDRLQVQGATLQRRTDHWVVLGDPGGLPFCVTPLPPD